VVEIDWLTVGAQIVNFLILVALLKHFLYRPVLDAMDRREKRIAEQLRQAETREKEADARARDFQDKSTELEHRRQELLDQARDEADAERRERLQEARNDVEQQRERWRAQLQQEWEDVRRSLTRRLAASVTEAARKALADLADTTLEEAMARTFSRRLADLSDADRRAIADGAGPIELATGFEPDDEMRTMLTTTVRESLGREVHFVRADGLVGGIELRTRGWKMSWTVAEYLRDFEDRVAETIAHAAHRVER
jgi:F-type H+-transporting ATPase subunit b